MIRKERKNPLLVGHLRILSLNIDNSKSLLSGEEQDMG